MKVFVPVLAAGAVLLFIVSVFLLTGRAEVKVDRAGMKLFAEHRYDEAMGTWQEGLRRDPGSVRLHYRVGTTLAMLGRFDEAQAEFDKVLVLAPRHAPTYFEMAMMSLRQEHYPEAEKTLEKTLGCARWYPDAHYWLGQLKEWEGKTEEARQLYIEELNVNPCSERAWRKVFGEKAGGGKRGEVGLAQ